MLDLYTQLLTDILTRVLVGIGDLICCQLSFCFHCTSQNPFIFAFYLSLSEGQLHLSVIQDKKLGLTVNPLFFRTSLICQKILLSLPLECILHLTLLPTSTSNALARFTITSPLR